MQYTEKYFVLVHRAAMWHELSVHETESEAVSELDFQYDMADQENRPIGLRAVRQSEVTIYTRSRA